MDLLVNDEYQLAEIGLVKEVVGSTVVFSVNGKEVHIEVNKETLENVQEIIKVSDEALFPIDLQTKTILLDGEVA